MTDIETAIMIKNMARETVKKMTVKNASSLKEGDKVRKKSDPDRKGRIELITGGTAMVFWPEDQTTSGIALDKIEAANTTAKNAGQKRYNIQHNVGSAKYLVNFHDGIKTHSDGSDFFDVKIFKNKPDLEAF